MRALAFRLLLVRGTGGIVPTIAITVIAVLGRRSREVTP